MESPIQLWLRRWVHNSEHARRVSARYIDVLLFVDRSQRVCTRPYAEWLKCTCTQTLGFVMSTVSCSGGGHGEGVTLASTVVATCESWVNFVERRSTYRVQRQLDGAVNAEWVFGISFDTSDMTPSIPTVVAKSFTESIFTVNASQKRLRHLVWCVYFDFHSFAWRMATHLCTICIN